MYGYYDDVCTYLKNHIKHIFTSRKMNIICIMYRIIKFLSKTNILKAIYRNNGCSCINNTHIFL